jgi:hypothetical protein
LLGVQKLMSVGLGHRSPLLGGFSLCSMALYSLLKAGCP